MTENVGLTGLELDTLKEICSVSVCQAATALSQMISKKISISMPQVRVLPLSEIHQFVGQPEKVIAGIYLEVEEEIFAGLLMSFSQNDALLLNDLLIEFPQGSTKRLDDIAQFTLKETGSILACSCLNALSSFMGGKTLVPSVPYYALDMQGAMLDYPIMRFSRDTTSALIAKIDFSEEIAQLKGAFYMLISATSLSTLLGVNRVYT